MILAVKIGSIAIGWVNDRVIVRFAGDYEARDGALRRARLRAATPPLPQPATPAADAVIG